MEVRGVSTPRTLVWWLFWWAMSKGLIPLYDIPVNTPCYCQVLGYDVVVVNNRMYLEWHVQCLLIFTPFSSNLQQWLRVKNGEVAAYTKKNINSTQRSFISFKSNFTNTIVWLGVKWNFYSICIKSIFSCNLKTTWRRLLLFFVLFCVNLTNIFM